MLDPVILWGGIGIFCGVAGASFVQGFVEARKKHKTKSELFAVTERDTSNHNVSPEIMVKLINAANGKLLEISTKKAINISHNHFEWEHEMYIVQEGQKLSEAVAMVMLMKGLEK
jgi:hypothetical protein